MQAVDRKALTVKKGKHHQCYEAKKSVVSDDVDNRVVGMTRGAERVCCGVANGQVSALFGDRCVVMARSHQKPVVSAENGPQPTAEDSDSDGVAPHASCKIG